MQVSRATSSIMSLLVSLDIYNSLNTKMQKQNETKIKKLQTKVVDSMIFGIHCNTFFQYTSVFLKFSVKTSNEKTSTNLRSFILFKFLFCLVQNLF